MNKKNNKRNLIGIIDFNPDQNPDRRQYIKRISSLIPKDFSVEGILFRDNRDVLKYDALILSGSRLSATDYQKMVEENQVVGGDYISVDKITEKLFKYKGPMLGICFGAQLIAYIMGGKLGKLEKTEAGYLEHRLTPQGEIDPIFNHLADIFYGAHLHTDYIAVLPKGKDIKESNILATRNGFIHAYGVLCNNGSMRYGVLFHPEMSNPSDATFLVDVNSQWLRKAIGDKEYEKARIVPKQADFEVRKTITKFVETLR